MATMVDDRPSCSLSDTFDRRCRRKSANSLEGSHVAGALDIGEPAADHVDILIFPVIF